MATTLKARIASDVAKFVDPDHFGSIATLTVSGVASTIYVNFIEAWVDMSPDGVELQDYGPVALCKYTDVDDAVAGSTLKIGTTTYYLVHKPEDNGFGMAVCRLSTETP